ncbi:MAG: hypothetical protein ACFB2Z_04185 [Maricaulaceae bacterium]
MQPNLDKYRPLLADMDLSDAQKDDALRALWSILSHFVDQAFDGDAVQHVFDEKAGRKTVEQTGNDRKLDIKFDS